MGPYIRSVFAKGKRALVVGEVLRQHAAKNLFTLPHIGIDRNYASIVHCWYDLYRAHQLDPA